MQWDCEELLLGETSLVLPCNFTSNLLAVKVASTNQRDTWFNAGYLEVFVIIDGVEFYAESRNLKFGSQLIRLPYLDYQLRYTAKDWLENTIIKIKQLESRDYLNMSGTAEITPKSIGNDTPITTPLSTVSVEIAPANPNRAPGGNIRNTSNKAMRFNCTGVACTNADPNIPIPAGGNYDIPSGYTGAITAIWASSGTGSSVVHTSSYI